MLDCWTGARQTVGKESKASQASVDPLGGLGLELAEIAWQRACINSLNRNLFEQCTKTLLNPTTLVTACTSANDGSSRSETVTLVTWPVAAAYVLRVQQIQSGVITTKPSTKMTTIPGTYKKCVSGCKLRAWRSLCSWALRGRGFPMDD